MIESIIVTLIWIGVICAIAALIIWALGKFGLELPPRVVQIAWVIVVLIIILVLWRAFGSQLPGF